MGPPVHREMGWLGKSLATFITGIRLETQMDVHVMLQLNPGAELLVTPEDYSGCSNHNFQLILQTELG